MENFTNNTIDVTKLPRFEEVQFTALHPNYWKVTLVNLFILLAILWAAIIVATAFDEQLAENKWTIVAIAGVLTFLIIMLSRLAFVKKGFAFRNHDVLFRSGIIATSTIVIPYNRIQHVALHEGLVSRFFGLAKVQVFTAGGSSSDIEIPGIEKLQAEDIKQLLMGKIQKQL